MIKSVQYKTRIPMLSIILAFMLSISNSSCKEDLIEPVSQENTPAINPPVAEKPRDTVIKYNYLVTNAKELISATKKATAGEVIYLDDNAKIDMTNLGTLTLNSKVTLRSGRGLMINGKVSQGALLFTNQMDHVPLIKVTGQGAKISHMRIIGPDTLTRADEVARLSQMDKQAGTGNKYYYTLPYARGIEIRAKNVEISDSELAGWSHAAIAVYKGGDDTYVHDCYIHHNQRARLGYGIALDQAYVKITNNLFNYNRHSISGYGNPGTSYEAAYNTVLEGSSGHAFDMHGGVDRGDGTNIAGTYVNIHNNTFYNLNDKAIKIRGYVQQSLIIKDNKFVQKNATTTIDLFKGTTIATISNNQYGVQLQNVQISLKTF